MITIKKASKFSAAFIALIFTIFMTFSLFLFPVAEAEEEEDSPFDDLGEASGMTAVNLTTIVTLLTGDLLTVIILIVIIGAVVGMLKKLGQGL